MGIVKVDKFFFCYVTIEENKVLLVNKDKGKKVGGATRDCKEEIDVWYLDNGASSHMTGARSKFRELDETATGMVKFGDGSMVEIKGKGSISFKCKNGEERILNAVYFIPTLCNNI